MLERLPLERGSPEERLSRLHPCSGVDSSLSLLCPGLSWCCVCVRDGVVERSRGRGQETKLGWSLAFLFRVNGGQSHASSGNVSLSSDSVMCWSGPRNEVF